MHCIYTVRWYGGCGTTYRERADKDGYASAFYPGGTAHITYNVKVAETGGFLLSYEVKTVAGEVVDIEYGTVTSAQPELEVVLDNDSIPLDANDIVVAWQLGAHERITESGEIIRFRSALEVGDRVIIASLDEKQQYFLVDKVED